MTMIVMMSAFGFADVDANDGQVLLSPGVHPVVIKSVRGVAISKLETKEDRKKAGVSETTVADFVEFNFANKHGHSMQKRFYFTGDAAPISATSILHIVDKVVPETEKDAVRKMLQDWEAKSKGDIAKFADSINAFVVGKEIEIMPILKLNQSGTGTKIDFGFPPFAQQKGLFGTPKSRLKYDPARNAVPKAATAATSVSKPGTEEAPDSNWGDDE